MNKLLIFILFVILESAGIIVKAQTFDKSRTDTKFSSLLGLIDQFYMDSTDMPKLTEAAIKALLKELDPHSVYIPKDEVEKTNEQLAGSFDGIGVTYQVFRDTIMIISPSPDGPSEKAGLMAGDKIVKINGEDAVGKKVDDTFIYARLRGKKGTEVKLAIKRLGVDSLLTYTIIRDKIPVNTVSAAYMLDDRTGYIKLIRFSTPSSKEIDDAIEALKKKGMQALVLDLRGNAGGYLNIAVEIAEEFLPANKKVVYTEGLKSPKQEYISGGNGKFTEGKLIVLIDEGSASASEIVSGALQDWDRALLIGRRSYGKGLVQKAYYLPDGSMVRLTTAKYYTPSGRCIQRPWEEGMEKYFKEFNRRVKHGELVNADSIHFPDSLKFHTTAGRTVYGGGGIMPDIFMSVDSSFSTNFYTEVIRKGLLNDYCVEYVEKNRAGLKAQFKDDDSYVAGFKTNDLMMKEFLAYCDKGGVKHPEDQMAKSTWQIQHQIKALIGRNLFGIQTYNKVMAQSDPVVLRACEIIKSGQEFRQLSLK